MPPPAGRRQGAGGGGGALWASSVAPGRQCAGSRAERGPGGDQPTNPHPCRPPSFSSLARLAVALTPDRGCWVGLPPALIARLLEGGTPLPLVLRVSPLAPAPGAPPPPPAIVAWGGAASRGATLDVPAALAAAAGLDAGAVVDVAPLPPPPVAARVCVTPADADDWETVAHAAADLEGVLLSQVGVAAVGATFPVFAPGGGRPVLLTVASVDPGPVARLAAGTEVVVAPREREAKAAVAVAAPAAAAATAARWAWARALAPPSTSAPALSSDALYGALAGLLAPPTTAASLAPGVAAAAGVADGGLVALARAPAAPAAVFEARIDPSLPPGHISLYPGAARAAGVAARGRCAARAAAGDASPPALVVLRPDRAAGSHALVEALVGAAPAALAALFCAWLRSQAATPGSRVPLADGSLVRLQPPIPPPSSRPGSWDVLVGASGDALPAGPARTAPAAPPGLDLVVELRWPGGARRAGVPALIAPADVVGGALRVELGASAELLEGGESDHPPPWPANERPPLYGPAWTATHVRPLLDALRPTLDWRVRAALAGARAAAPRAGVLLAAPAGGGKTGLAAAVATALSTDPHCVAGVVRVACRDLDPAAAPGAARAALARGMRAALAAAPALLVLDDVDALTPVGDEDAPPEAGGGGAGVAGWLAGALARTRAGAGAPALALLATATDAGAVAPVLRGPGGLALTIMLPAPGAAERRRALAALLARRGVAAPSPALAAAAPAAAGCDAADLAALVERVVHASAARRAAGGGPAAGGPAAAPPSPTPGGATAVTLADVRTALANFAPAATWAAGGGRGAGERGPAGWADVGGAAAARAALVDALSLPALAGPDPPPLRLRTGVMLYGPPGCGKTHIVRAALAAAGTRVVVVRGPELLNKYIGASEAAVRAVFARAAAAAPCALFFDEFDALAPARGRDTTGVSDRVVNQLLAELDGAAGLAGVTVVAATSRPDMVDPALLRPGRLDRLVYVGVPTAAERREILAAASRNAEMTEEGRAMLDSIADGALGFTGADLAAVVAEAALAAARGALAGGKASDGPPPITVTHLAAARAATRPSLGAGEAASAAARHAAFRGARAPAAATPDGDAPPGSRVTVKG